MNKYTILDGSGDDTRVNVQTTVMVEQISDRVLTLGQVKKRLAEIEVMIMEKVELEKLIADIYGTNGFKEDTGTGEEDKGLGGLHSAEASESAEVSTG